MSYKYDTLGLDAQDITALLNLAPSIVRGGSQALKVTQRLLADPHLQEALCEARRVSNVLDNKAPGAPCRRTGRVSKARLARGVGLNQALLPTRAFILHRQYPWALPLAIGGTVGLVFLAGFFIGKGSKK